MSHRLLADASFHGLLLSIDADLAAEARSGGCGVCGGRLHVADYPRKPRGHPAGLGAEWSRRHHFCCASEDCRRRLTPRSVRFLDARVYTGVTVVLAAALAQGLTARRLAKLREELGPEFVVAPLGLHRLDDDAGDAAGVTLEGGLDLPHGPALALFVAVLELAGGFEAQLGIVDAPPGEPGIERDLARLGVRQAHRVASAKVQRDECVAVVDLVDADLVRLPVEGRRERRLGAEAGLVELRIPVADGPAREAGEEDEMLLARGRVEQEGAVRAPEVEHHRRPVGELVAAEGLVSLLGIGHGGIGGRAALRARPRTSRRPEAERGLVQREEGR